MVLNADLKLVCLTHANSGDSDQMSRSVTSDLGLHCLPVS